MNYPPYNPYLYPQGMAQQGQQGPFIPQAMNQQAQLPAQGQQSLSQASRLVASREEAIGVAADFSGALMLFPDVTHERVYLKRWNYQTGAADFIEFAPVVQAPPQPPAFASLQDLQDLQSTVDSLRQELDRLKKPQSQPKAPVKKERTDANE